MSSPMTASDSSKVSERGNMAPTVCVGAAQGDDGHLSAVDTRLAHECGSKPATWHARRFGLRPVNQLAARIIVAWRASGDFEELAAWVRPIEAALGAMTGPGRESARLRAALADAAEDCAEAEFVERPCPETARLLLRKRAADRLASLEHDREIAGRFGITI